MTTNEAKTSGDRGKFIKGLPDVLYTLDIDHTYRYDRYICKENYNRKLISIKKKISYNFAYYFSSEIVLLWNNYLILSTGGRLNKKDGLTRYGDSHVKDKTS